LKKRRGILRTSRGNLAKDQELYFIVSGPPMKSHTLGRGTPRVEKKRTMGTRSVIIGASATLGIL